MFIAELNRGLEREPCLSRRGSWRLLSLVLFREKCYVLDGSGSFSARFMYKIWQHGIVGHCRGIVGIEGHYYKRLGSSSQS